jgi:opacity protein-like surface antigen
MTEMAIRSAWIASLFVMIVATCSPVSAEFYLGGQGGVNVPRDLSDIRGTGPRSGVTSSDLNLRNQIAYGVKAGYYLPDAWKWIGVETEFYHSDSNIERQRITANNSILGSHPDGSISRTGLAVNTWALNVLVRYSGERVEPYAGVGVTLNYALIRTAPRETTLFPGLNVVAGIRAFVTTDVALFTEYKYNQGTIEFSDQHVRADYRTNFFMAGVSYHFQ